jgi:Fur family iron response transcriptional regulator
MPDNLIQMLREHGIAPSAQRLAVAAYVLHTTDHPSADEVWNKLRGSSEAPGLARATVYNTLNLFVRKGLLQQFALTDGRALFDPNTHPHHHFLDEETGRLHDLPWDAVDLRMAGHLGEFDVRGIQVILRGRHTPPESRASP